MGRRIQFAVLLLVGLFILPVIAVNIVSISHISPAINDDIDSNPSHFPSLESSLKVSARSAVTCSSVEMSTLPANLSLSSGECSSLNLGTLVSESVLDISVQVSDSPIDLLFFNENGATTYLAGQNYHLAMTADPTLESLSGTVNFHWQVPASLTDKGWFIIIDNMAHPGDENFGDQGANSSIVSLDVELLPSSEFDLFHGLAVLAPGSHSELAGGSELTFDAGDKLTITTWPISGDADLYLMTDDQRANYLSNGNGEAFISGASLTSITTQQTLVWSVPAELDGIPLHLMFDNEAEPTGGGEGIGMAKVSIKLELTPVLSPEFSIQGGELGTTIGFQAAMPNSHNQINTLQWDFDTSVDSDDNGVNDDDNDAGGWGVSTTYLTPGVFEVSLTIASLDGRSATIAHSVTIIDTVAPTFSVSIPGLDSEMHALVDHSQLITATANAEDAHAIASINWIVDGTLQGSGSSIDLQWGIPGEHQVEIIVSDPSGNSDSVSITVEVIDTTTPVINEEKTSVPVNAQEGKTVTFNASALDAWDEASDLHYAWDLDPDFDSDNDGNARNDADLQGANLGHIFQHHGKTEIVLTVTDAAGNSDSAGFTIQVSPAPSEGNMFALVLIISIVAIATSVAGLIGYRKVQEHAAIQLLVNHGLSAEEAETQILSIKVNQKLSVFANAETLAGLDSGDVKTVVQLQNDEKSQLSQQLYGGDPVPASQISDPNAGFQRSSNAESYGGHAGYGGNSRANAENELARIAGVTPATSGYAQGQQSRVLSEDEFSAFADDVAAADSEQSTHISDAPASNDHFNPITQDSPSSQTAQTDQQSTAAAQKRATSMGVVIPQNSAVSEGEIDEDVAFLKGLQMQGDSGSADAMSSQSTSTQTTAEAPSQAPDTNSGATEQEGLVEAACGACGAHFALTFPDGINEVLVDCPSCSVEQVLRS
jgi:hypothetical protein